MRELGSVPGLGRSPGGQNGNPLQYSCLENPHGQRSLVSYSPWGRKDLIQLSKAQHMGESTVFPLLSSRDMFQDPQWMLETKDSTESYIYYVFSCMYIHIYYKV